MSGAELIPDLSVVVHGWIVKGGLVLVKEKGGEDKKRLESFCNLDFIYSNGKV